MTLITLFQQAGYSCTFATATTESKFAVDLSFFDIETKSINVNDSHFDSFIKNLNPSIVLFDRFMMEEQFGWRVVENCPMALRILDTEDLHGLREARKIAFKKKEEFLPEHLHNNITKREIASILRSDLSLIISEYEMELLGNFFKIDSALLHYLPFLTDSLSENDYEHLPLFDERRHFVSIGNFHHEPNWNAVLYLKEEIWPRINTLLPKAELHIYGAYPTQKVIQLHSQEERFLVKGRAVSSENVVMDARLLLAPLRFGAGLKGKLLEAVQCGTPSITTSIGAEGMMGEDGEWPGAIHDEPEEFSKAAVDIYQDRAKWNKAQNRGIEVLNSRFLKSEFVDDFMKRIDAIRTDLKLHRTKNFMGSMLMHQTLASTKYMSKWIEAKNRNLSE